MKNFLITLLLLFVITLIACEAKKTSQVTPLETVEISPTPTPAPTPTPTPTPTPAPTPTLPAVQMPGSCLVIDEVFCGSGKVVKWIPPYGPPERYLIGFKLPKGTKIFSPFDGYYQAPTGGKVLINPQAKIAQVGLNSKDYISLDDVVFAAIGGIEPDPKSRQVLKGEVIAEVSDPTFRVLPEFEYNVVFEIAKFDRNIGAGVTQIEFMKQLFPYFEAPTR